MTVSILLADDQATVRRGLRLVIGTQPDFEVVGEATDGREAVDAARRLEPDVVLLDIAMPGMSGIAAARELLAAPRPPRIVMLTTYDTDENLEGSLRAGVSGFLLKVSPPERLFAAIRTAASGLATLDPAVTARVMAGYVGAPATPDGLTRREREVLVLIGRGLSNAEIAAVLFIGPSTVGTHINRLLAKLRLRDRAEAVRYAYEHGLVRPRDP
ncbi:response regulator [Planomonospora venezuelensis]|uniref:DNA-binding NarL/FixJ family response regulator n=1 Tax=Planomonospora venezuelensis TaxID=1999 RepID=A0A841D4I9_PLAVE|nr:response regulator transcription factor [Planomonospora venezuelensis]MBB5962376.1 DNA-binding NarL/FixJ family response regulator [Planomonospora venezuelensis]GIN00758.1 DNA-binding response regulator [Planomonospora venezuelensis]